MLSAFCVRIIAEFAWIVLGKKWRNSGISQVTRGLLMNFLGVFVKSYTELTRGEEWEPDVYWDYSLSDDEVGLRSVWSLRKT